MSDSRDQRIRSSESKNSNNNYNGPSNSNNSSSSVNSSNSNSNENSNSSSSHQGSERSPPATMNSSEASGGGGGGHYTKYRGGGQAGDNYNVAGGGCAGPPTTPTKDTAGGNGGNTGGWGGAAGSGGYGAGGGGGGAAARERRNSRANSAEMMGNKCNMANMTDMMNRRNEIPDDLACFLQQQKQRQARLETTMRSFPSSLDVEADRQELKRKRTTHEDPLSHRVIEKRRRDRMNNCLADLSRLIPSTYMKKGRGRVEKTEIIEMAIKHMKHLQSHACREEAARPDGCELANELEAGLNRSYSLESFRVGYHECLTELMHFLVEKEGLYSGDTFCVRMMTHLQKHYDRLGRASTSEILSNVGRTWSGTALPSATANDRRDLADEQGVKSEISDESGYFSSSVKADVEVVNLSLHDGGEERAGLEEPERRGRPRQSSYSPASERRHRRSSSNSGSREGDRNSQPSDLSKKGDTEIGSEPCDPPQLGGSGGGAGAGLLNMYKFKSNIRQRFGMQTDTTGDQRPGPQDLHQGDGEAGEVVTGNNSSGGGKRQRVDSLESSDIESTELDYTTTNGGREGGRGDAGGQPSPRDHGIPLLSRMAANYRHESLPIIQERYPSGGHNHHHHHHHQQQLNPNFPHTASSPSPSSSSNSNSLSSNQPKLSDLSSPGTNNPGHYSTASHNQSPSPSSSATSSSSLHPAAPYIKSRLSPTPLLVPADSKPPLLLEATNSYVGGVPSAIHHAPSQSPKPPPLPQTIPIFALNAKGSYYVPMSVDLSVISPFLSLFAEEHCAVLHPVTISVNFQAGHLSNQKARTGVIQQPSVIKHWRDHPN